MKRMDITKMSDRELRMYRRRLRHQRAQRRRIALALSALFLVCVGVISYHTLKSNAESSEPMFKYYTNVTLQYGDTVWELADRYIDYDQYKDKEDYIDEVCSINRLSDCDGIAAGETLVFPYYSEEYK